VDDDMGAFSNGRPASAGGTGQAPSWHSAGTQSALARAAGANPLLANPSFAPNVGGGGGSGGRYASFGQQGGGSAPTTGYGALARGGAGGRPEGYWGPKPGAGGGFSQPSSRDVWTPSGTSGFVGKQPKGTGQANKKPKPAAGATKDGSPWAPPLRRVVVAAPAMQAMRAAADAPTPAGLLDTPDFHGASSVPDLAHLDKKAGEDTKDHGGHYVRSSLFAPPAPKNGGPHGAVRRSLPVFKYRSALIDAFANNPVTIVEGETGSGRPRRWRSTCWSTPLRPTRP
jgi:ATP-dependent RNA helicase DHX57